MKSLLLASLVVVNALVVPTMAAPQNPPAAAAGTDIYHVMFTKAAPGHAAELAKVLMTPDKTSPMPDHFVVLRHQEGDDWDYAVIEHLGAKAEVSATAPPQTAARPLTAWHSDTFVSGPNWGEFSKQMALGAAGNASPVYVVGVQRAVAGHRDQLLASLNAPARGSSKIETGNVTLQHVEGGDWNFMTITRYNSWQDLGADRAGLAAPTASTAGGWADLRQHSAFHRDTITDRIFPAK
jgi:hypothetical protein